MNWLLRVLILSIFALSGCHSGFRQAKVHSKIRFEGLQLSPLSNLDYGDSQLRRVCGRPGSDRVRKLFCGANPPQVRSLAELQRALGLDFANNPPGFALLGHSTSLVTRSVSALNPRAFVFSAPTSDFVVVSFTRGENIVEIVAGDPVTKERAFYLLSYAQPCDLAGGCSHGERLTPVTERNWLGVALYEDEDLKNTILDCRHCHQPNGPGTKKILRMQELENPWTHWFEPNLAGGKALQSDFFAAHGSEEPYAGIPASILPQSNPPAFEAFIKLLGDGDQPNEFDSRRIEEEMIHGASPSWLKIFENFRLGRSIAVPSYKLRVTDPVKLKAMTAAYKEVRMGQRSLAQLPDIREVFPDDQESLAAMGLAVKPGQTAQQILVNACAQCHNASLDQTISRARFNVDLSKVSASVRAAAVMRINLPDDNEGLMPPHYIRSLSGQEKQILTDYLTNP